MLNQTTLVLINQVFFDSPFSYSPIPVLIDVETKKEETMKGEIIEEAYNMLKKIEKMEFIL